MRAANPNSFLYYYKSTKTQKPELKNETEAIATEELDDESIESGDKNGKQSGMEKRGSGNVYPKVMTLKTIEDQQQQPFSFSKALSILWHKLTGANDDDDHNDVDYNKAKKSLIIDILLQ